MLPITFKEERRKPGKRCQRKVVHCNHLKPCFSPPEMHKKPSQLTSSGHREDRPQAENFRGGQQASRGTLVNPGDVKLEWLENPVATVAEVSHPSQERESSGTLETLRYPDIGVRVRVVYPYT